MFCKNGSKSTFIELKTDIDSMDDEQIDYLIKTKENGWQTAFNNVKEIKRYLKKTSQTKSLQKYEALFKYINNKEIDILLENEMKIDIVYIHPIATKIIRNKEILFNSINFDFITNNILSKESDIVSKSFFKILGEIYKDSLEKNKRKRLENQYQTIYNISA